MAKEGKPSPSFTGNKKNPAGGVTRPGREEEENTIESPHSAETRIPDDRTPVEPTA